MMEQGFGEDEDLTLLVEIIYTRLARIQSGFAF